MKDYTSDDTNMFGLYKEGLDHLNTKYSTGQDQFTPKLKTRGNPEQRLSYASYFEEDDTPTLEPGTQAIYEPDGSVVNVVHVNEKDATATIELPDETIMYRVPMTELKETL